jgi:hypothetical protein
MAEITLQDSFGKNIHDTILKYNLTNNLEIGSWDGTGSTKCFIEAMKTFQDKQLFCLEISKDRFSSLIQNTSMYSWIHCYNTTSVTTQEMESFDTLWSSPFNKLSFSREEVLRWYTENISEMNEHPISYFSQYKNRKYDGVLIDGSEFTGYSEFEYIRDKARVIFLDDCCKAMKTTRCLHELESSQEWECIFIDRNLRHGAATFIRK